MNSTLKTVIVVVVVLVVIAAVFKMAGWGFSGQNTVLDNGQMTASSTGATGASGSAGGSAQAGNTGTNAGANGATSLPANPAISDSTLALLINSAVIRVPQTGVDVTLTQGAANYSDSAVKGRVTVGRVLAKVATESGFDVFVDMSVTKDGQPAVNKYLALFRNSGQTVSFSSAVLVGDRLALSSLIAASNNSTIDKMPAPYMSSSAGYNVTLTYLDRKNGEAVSATPTVSKTVGYSVKNHAITK